MKQDYLAALLGPWSSELNPWSVLLRIALPLVLGAVIGCERASKRHSAGLRTFMLMSMAGSALMLIDQFIMAAGPVEIPILSGASIIGMATISCSSILFSSRNQIKGLTTSVALWACGIIGLASGAGFYTLSIVLFALLLWCLSWFPVLEKYLKDRSNHFEVNLELNNRSNLVDFVATVRALGIRIEDIESNPAYLNSGLSVFSVSFTVKSSELKKYKNHEEIIAALQSLEYVHYIEEL